MSDASVASLNSLHTTMLGWKLYVSLGKLRISVRSTPGDPACYVFPYNKKRRSTTTHTRAHTHPRHRFNLQYRMSYTLPARAPRAGPRPEFKGRSGQDRLSFAEAGSTKPGVIARWANQSISLYIKCKYFMFGAYTKDFGDCTAASPAAQCPDSVSLPHMCVCVYVSGACLF